jgi:hypothetical protein
VLLCKGKCTLSESNSNLSGSELSDDDDDDDDDDDVFFRENAYNNSDSNFPVVSSDLSNDFFLRGKEVQRESFID